ncbi:hypothetical protein Hanom_Chr04g00308341 [Helianthus anomalus]
MGPQGVSVTVSESVDTVASVDRMTRHRHLKLCLISLQVLIQWQASPSFLPTKNSMSQLMIILRGL